MTDIVASSAVMALIQVVMIDLVLAGDNAIVIGLAAAGLPPEQRKRVILIGILAATALRIAQKFNVGTATPMGGISPQRQKNTLWQCLALCSSGA
jgi:predicted tellurium resistance membrane protein TerC